MYGELDGIVEDLFFHKEEGAGHWWDAGIGEGVDCVDWPPLFDMMKEHTLEEFPLAFDYVAPAPWVNDSISFVRYGTFQNPDALASIQSTFDNGAVEVTTENIASLELNTSELSKKGVTSVSVNGESLSLDEERAAWGQESGKNSRAHGPFNQVFHRPFCFVYGSSSDAYQYYASYLSANWAIIGNGSCCTLPLSAVTEDLRNERNLVFIGVAQALLPWLSPSETTWGTGGITLGGESFPDSAFALVTRDQDRLSGIVSAAEGMEHILYRLMPFTSRYVVPDYYIWGVQGGLSAGFFQNDWSL